LIVDNLEDLPDGWILTTLGDLGSWSSGGTPSRTESQYYNGDIPWIKTGDLSDGLLSEIEEKITVEGLKNSSAKIFPVNSLVVAMYGATIGRLGILKIPAATNQACGVLLAQGITDQLIQYLFYYLLSSRETLRKIGKGGAQPNISQTLLKEFPCPLPPLNEQRRIVSTIEQLTDRSNKARAALEDVPKLIEQFRQSVLAAAFRGDLTADWREKNPDVEPASELLERTAIQLGENYQETRLSIDRSDDCLPKSWSWSKLKLVVRSIQSGKSFSCPEIPVTKDTVGLAKISAVTWDKFNSQETKTVIDKSKIDPKLFIKSDDLLVSRANTLELVGASVVVEEIDYKIMLSDKVWRIHLVDTDKKYVHYYLKSALGRKEIESRANGNQASMRNLSQKAFQDIIIPIPPIEEQHKIVRHIEDALDAIDSILTHKLATLEELNQLDRSILAKAFRGELVPQDPNDEPAAVLLERIRAEREQTSTPKQRGKTTRKNSSKQLSIDGIE
jgi:type I restriction enzyme, S subunit